MTEHLEIERKYDVADDVPWVDLGSLSGVQPIGPPRQDDLRAEYFDTDRLDLARAGITLRRRTGGTDAGWHLKLPVASGGRMEHAEPFVESGSQPPAALIDLVQAWVRDRDLLPIATLSTRRMVHRLLAADGQVLAEAADDVVTAEASGLGDGSATLSHWREWEIELVDGPAELIEAAGALMTEAGAAPSTWSSKLERALGGRVIRPARPRAEGLSPASRAGDVVHAHLVEQVEAMINRDWQARHDEPDGVHKMRVATRRLRSALATFRPLFDRSVTDPIRDELKWIATELGGARDAEVLRTRLLTELATEADDLVLGPISARIEVELLADHRKAHDALVVALRSERYFRLLDRLDELIAAPPFTPLADGKAGKVLTRRVRKSYRRVQTLVSAGAPEDAVRRDGWYHEIRKASKRLRYAAESVTPAFGKPATGLAEAAEQLQEVLGEHQDSVVARAALRELGVRIYLDGENAFTIGRLHAIEQTRGDEAIEEFESAWSALSDKQVLRWLGK
jgi:CHAD domain-containing protein